MGFFLQNPKPKRHTFLSNPNYSFIFVFEKKLLSELFPSFLHLNHLKRFQF